MDLISVSWTLEKMVGALSPALFSFRGTKTIEFAGSLETRMRRLSLVTLQISIVRCINPAFRRNRSRCGCSRTIPLIQPSGRLLSVSREPQQSSGSPWIAWTQQPPPLSLASSCLSPHVNCVTSVLLLSRKMVFGISLGLNRRL